MRLHDPSCKRQAKSAAPDTDMSPAEERLRHVLTNE